MRNPFVALNIPSRTECAVRFHRALGARWIGSEQCQPLASGMRAAKPRVSNSTRERSNARWNDRRAVRSERALALDPDHSERAQAGAARFGSLPRTHFVSINPIGARRVAR
jgi:hypothetical protein